MASFSPICSLVWCIGAWVHVIREHWVDRDKCNACNGYIGVCVHAVVTRGRTGQVLRHAYATGS
jgi:hypothetical protein